MTQWKSVEIEFVSQERQQSEYDWANISKDDQRVGKARCRIDGARIIIFSINIFPEWAGHGFGRMFVEFCKSRYHTVVADRVRQTAIGFWEAMGFHDCGDGNWEFTTPGE